MKINLKCFKNADIKIGKISPNEIYRSNQNHNQVLSMPTQIPRRRKMPLFFE
jgi:hypothetical protein